MIQSGDQGHRLGGGGGGTGVFAPPHVPQRAALNLRKSLHRSLLAHQAGAYPGFRIMKQQGVFLLLPGWDVSPLLRRLIAGLPPAVNLPVPIYTPGWREAL